ncbi:efflux RND transporter periplasmic adaptor subunit [Desulfoluna spongiiphila]|uniref:RND family efflux transporter, MFP subunit n=1 Tax=Desulfoluna spongiiphila TaxID=419481 RepID=A0A1G5AFM3_9BACT|nr:efflux RND transporter periplasmic adaptor subunit [Desulfoluna spongiiphila]SCX76654.1 RND family efflux transporter, MFP subunit [Desulfoluna spongiiphila]VVS90633.1 rnd efflux pump membrane fusion protein [Desulfoluna spongiiphila]
MIRTPQQNSKAPMSRRLTRAGLPLLILAAAFFIGSHLMDSKPKAEKRPRTALPPLVRWEEARTTNHPVTVSAMGTVRASAQIDLKARVGGQVEWLAPALVPGGRFKKGEILIKLDKADLDISLALAGAKVQQARADLSLEQGSQEVARKELALMETTMGHRVKDQSLALRLPQLKIAEANLALAEADLDKALLDLARSEIRAPFGGIVLSRSAPVGTLVTEGQTVATLADDDTWWVEATLPVKDLAWLRLPKANETHGSQTRVLTQTGAAFRGRLIQVLGDLSDMSRMARVLIEVDDPMEQAAATGAPPLLLNSYVTAELEGKPLRDIIALPDRALRDGNEVWVADGDTLRIRTVRIVWREGATVFTDRGIAPGERVILSDLSSPADGMKIRTRGEKKDKKASGGPAGG